MGSSSVLKALGLALTTIIVIGMGHGVAKADEVTVAGYTNGCFGPACVPANTAAPQTASLFGLTFNNAQFNGVTSAGFLAIGNMPVPPPTQNVDNLGSLTLNGTPANYTGQSFTLRVTFTLPPGIAGSNTSTYSANLTGNVTALDDGGVFVNFNPTPTLFTFSFVNGAGQTVTGSFNFNVNSVSVIAGGIVPITGNITGAQQRVTGVPEPASMLLLGTGLVGAAGFARRRFRN